ncbi:MAG TPA: PqqD family protein [Roseimicrobium sp.]|nr:PqqD family protein [Roseimicrobium sp.]
MILNLQAKVRLKKDVLIQVVNGESILLNLQNENYYALDDVGTCAIQLFQENESVAVAVSKMCAFYDVQEDQLLKDLDVLVQDCEKNGLVEIIAS